MTLSYQIVLFARIISYIFLHGLLSFAELCPYAPHVIRFYDITLNCTANKVVEILGPIVYNYNEWKAVIARK